VADFVSVETGSAAQVQAPAPSPRRVAVCVPVPRRPDPTESAANDEALPRRPDRPEDFTRYGLPVDARDVRVEPINPGSANGGESIHISVPPNQAVHEVRLEGQSDRTRVVFVGEQGGWKVITAHTITRERGNATVVLVHSGLAVVDRNLTGASVENPIVLEAGAPLGEGGGQGLLLTARQLRRDVTLAEAVPELSPASVLATDVRNVLPLRAP
jgi:hypothetical protein